MTASQCNVDDLRKRFEDTTGFTVDLQTKAGSSASQCEVIGINDHFILFKEKGEGPVCYFRLSNLVCITINED